jgi:hypothetical protein
MSEKPTIDSPKYFRELSGKQQSEVLKVCEGDIQLAYTRVWFYHNDKWCSYQV